MCYGCGSGWDKEVAGGGAFELRSEILDSVVIQIFKVLAKPVSQNAGCQSFWWTMVDVDSAITKHRPMYSTDGAMDGRLLSLYQPQPSPLAQLCLSHF